MLIVNTVISVSLQYNCVGKDIDLLVLMTALAPERVCFNKSGRSKIPNALYSKIVSKTKTSWKTFYLFALSVAVT